jgi:Xaa-Pro aminopeptidase
MSTDDRRAALVRSLPGDVDAVLVTKGVNVRYLTGFTGSNAAVLVCRDGPAVLATDGRYDEQARTEAPDLQLLVTRALAGDLVAAAVAAGVHRLAIERHHVTLAAYDALSAVADGIELVGVGEPVEDLRIQKDDEEIRALRQACAYTDAALTHVLARLRPGVTEREVAWALLVAMRDAGAQGAAFDSIVAFGPHSAIPHHQPTDRPLERGDLVTLDFGAKVDGYHADMTRTVVCGPALGWQQELHTTVRTIQAQCREATVRGAAPAELDATARQKVADGGHTLVHGLGHGVGLEIHEQPFAVPGTTAARLTDRVPMTVEPGIYLPGRGGVRIEDTVLVGADGAEPLTTSPRDLIEI